MKQEKAKLAHDAELFERMQAQKLIDWFQNDGSKEGFEALFGQDGKIKVE